MAFQQNWPGPDAQQIFFILHGIRKKPLHLASLRNVFLFLCAE
jgi:hypothetical protein